MLHFLNCRCSLIRRFFLLAALQLLAPTAPGAQAAPTILIFGDSLSAGYGIRPEAAWPALLARRLQEKGLDYSVVNASISGETSSGGRARIDAALARYSPRILILALGANDGLRGLPVAQLRDNLTAIVASAQRKKATVLLVGQRLPPNYGVYASEFHDSFGAVAKVRKTALVDFLLAGVATQPQLFQADNLHPTAEAQALLLDNVWRGLAPLLE
ncbi:MAG TPA: arylesterase [Accumulibacter sp.]|uniref:arylesterase n=1 Tax=Accumulibacter sp. TaxID=2053492 RepID=UPI000EC64EB1|nr:arylesterase [Accumulibacter sp.]HCZ13706.1 arylesterase [Accumulibacter sp.]HRF73722.1 arylesterase [Accumulibacter sp.]